ncbi:FAD-dependent monooxygenase [Shinella sp. DD12]|jgi:2-polyprenyl-6-methoxyphenol hydroxylase-like FAD-dependent oxidoreductase|uniref:FAD-dependent monooxygenase n=1 Tax=unclassified Shinella TaxID=2643062 RepID=UPI0003C54E7E|nr:FAD-dependent monooxygenase [Shinella sp. DD12]EYR81539.1 putative oxidoreductase transmembrane protein [Shinella sp. DD12]
MRILIVGGGPAGLTLAACLLRHGIEPVVVEKAAHGRTGGYSIGLHINGWQVAERLGLVEAFRAKAMPLGPAHHLDRRGRKLFSYDYRTLAKAAEGRLLAIMRSDFHEILTKAVVGRCPIRYETTVTALEDDGSGVDAIFSDGSRERFDLVVGADGYRSTVRALAFGPHEDFLRPLGYRASAWRVPLEEPLGASFVGMMDVDHQGGLYAAGDGTAATLFCWRDERTDRLDPEARRTVLQKAFGHWPEPVASALRSAIDWDQAFFDTVAQIEMPTWSKGRIVLLGDAAWCLTFLAGQGTSTAMAGAYILAAELARKTHTEALESYEARMRPLVTRMQSVSRKIGGHYIPQSTLGMRLQSWILPIMLSRPFIRFTSSRLAAPPLALD